MQRIAMKTGASVTAALMIASAIPLAHAQEPDLSCKQEPGNRFYWVERAFCDLSPNGPERAHGIIIWNHGIQGTTESWKAPAPPSFRLLQTRGWDVIMLKRHHLAETMPGGPLTRTVQRTLEEVAAQRKLGYKKVVLAGQSFGGYVSLEAVDTSDNLDAVVALSPGIRDLGATGRLDPSVTDRILQRAKVGRIALVLPKNDALFNYIPRGESARAIMSKRNLPYLLLDETTELSGHGGGVTGRFALRYGLCLADFLAAPTIPTGRFACTAVADEWSVVRELLLPIGDQRPNFVRDATALPESVRSLIGLRWGLLEDTLVLVAPVDDGSGRLRLLYRSTGIGGGVFEAAVKEGSIQAVLSNRSTVTLIPGGEGTMTWTAANGSRSVKASLVRGRDDP